MFAAKKQNTIVAESWAFWSCTGVQIWVQILATPLSTALALGKTVLCVCVS